MSDFDPRYPNPVSNFLNRAIPDRSLWPWLVMNRDVFGAIFWVLLLAGGGSWIAYEIGQFEKLQDAVIDGGSFFGAIFGLAGLAFVTWWNSKRQAQILRQQFSHSRTLADIERATKEWQWSMIVSKQTHQAGQAIVGSILETFQVFVTEPDIRKYCLASPQGVRYAIQKIEGWKSNYVDISADMNPTVYEWLSYALAKLDGALDALDQSLRLHDECLKLHDMEKLQPGSVNFFYMIFRLAVAKADVRNNVIPRLMELQELFAVAKTVANLMAWQSDQKYDLSSRFEKLRPEDAEGLLKMVPSIAKNVQQ